MVHFYVKRVGKSELGLTRKPCFYTIFYPTFNCPLISIAIYDEWKNVRSSLARITHSFIYLLSISKNVGGILFLQILNSRKEMLTKIKTMKKVNLYGHSQVFHFYPRKYLGWLASKPLWPYGQGQWKRSMEENLFDSSCFIPNIIIFFL